MASLMATLVAQEAPWRRYHMAWEAPWRLWVFDELPLRMLGALRGAREGLGSPDIMCMLSRVAERE
jgi:hypothetical protein